jgi:hypothetical protein
MSDMRQLAPLEGLQRVFEHCCAIPRNLTTADVQRLIHWSRDISFFDMAVADLNSATTQLSLIATGRHGRDAKSELPLLVSSGKI